MNKIYRIKIRTAHQTSFEFLVRSSTQPTINLLKQIDWVKVLLDNHAAICVAEEADIIDLM